MSNYGVGGIRRRGWSRWLQAGVLGAWSAVAVMPLLWMVYASLESDQELGASLVPTPGLPRFSHWVTVLSSQSVLPMPVSRYLANTFIVAIPATAVAVVAGALGAYGMVRFRPKGSGLLQAFVIFLLPVPVFAVMVPVYLYMHSLGLTNSRVGLVLVWSGFNVSFALIVMRGFFSRLPTDIIEASLVEGCTEVGAFRRVVLPLAVAPVTSAALLIFIGLWGEFPMAVVMIQNQQLMTIQPALTTLAGVGPGGTGSLSLELSALAVTNVVPIGVFLLVRRRIFDAIVGRLGSS